MATLERDGVGIAYQVHGGPRGATPMLLTHGFAATSEMWAPNLGALTLDRQVITWDIRGHGASDAPADQRLYSEAASVADMAAVLDAAGAARAVVGGLSLGGYLSLAFALRHPDRVVALLLFDTGPGFRRDDARAAWNATAEGYAVAIERDGLAGVRSGPEVERAHHRDPAGVARAARGILTQHDDHVIRSLGHVAVPTLVLAGSLDEPFLPALDYMAARIPHATKIVLEAAGHAANLDQPAAFNQAVVDFLADV